jgi:hypothetical protein
VPELSSARLAAATSPTPRSWCAAASGKTRRASARVGIAHTVRHRTKDKKEEKNLGRDTKLFEGEPMMTSTKKKEGKKKQKHRRRSKRRKEKNPSTTPRTIRREKKLGSCD